ncbi:VirC2 family conjugal transfer protein [Agrobacterium sp. SHOUNA12C]|jgi:hypothetical protein|nr:VirC2 family conjugal transfer protein [Agrobacterium sp. BETTINA12B]MCJ9755102.1 VirC2 family conjugal transfer protein [Agrobacterium sp. SHOUNA12C]
MAIRKPNLSVTEARRLANVRSAATDSSAVSMPPSPAAATAPATPAPTAEPVAPTANAKPTAADLRPPISSTLPSATKTSSHRPARVKEITRSATEPSPHIFPARSDKVQVFVSALLPAPGVSPVFELLCRQHPPQKALQMILRRALHDYDEMLDSGAFQKAAVTYAPDDTVPVEFFVQTSRMMLPPLLAIARAHFDPLGLESSRAFGRKLATAALAAFFARELKRPI